MTKPTTPIKNLLITTLLIALSISVTVNVVWFTGLSPKAQDMNMLPEHAKNSVNAAIGEWRDLPMPKGAKS